MLLLLFGDFFVCCCCLVMLLCFCCCLVVLLYTRISTNIGVVLGVGAFEGGGKEGASGRGA